ncbi:hypothetical protein PENSUB_5108 [Penicillium subrubescens]|uniref:Uncharacterized protein n=1 Tax=Penicillium subrubescens TaxID=1316194 RepID=A0A1Q5UAP0_9EURO|nr:hypothetical protein PENSUB_5108 [Penicillium subrubescens]
MAPESVGERTISNTGDGPPRWSAKVPVLRQEEVVYGLWVVPCIPNCKAGVALRCGECDFEIRSYPGPFVLGDPNSLSDTCRCLEEMLANDAPFPVRTDESFRLDLVILLVTIEVVDNPPLGVLVTPHHSTG